MADAVFEAYVCDYWPCGHFSLEAFYVPSGASLPLSRHIGA